MQYLYCCCAFAALIRMWRSPFIAFKFFLAVSIITRLFWHPYTDELRWTHWLLICEPLVIGLSAIAVLECGHVATMKYFPSARRSLLTMATLAGLGVFVLLFKAIPLTLLGITVGIRLCFKSAIAAFALFGVMSLWWKGESGDNYTWRHALALTVFLVGNAAVGIWGKSIHDNPTQWDMANMASWINSCGCMVYWCFIGPFREHEHDSRYDLISY